MSRLVKAAGAALFALALSVPTSAHHVPVPDEPLNGQELVTEFVEQKGAILSALDVYWAASSGGESVVEANAVESAFTVSIEHIRGLSVRDCLKPVKRAILGEIEAAADWFRAYLREPEAVDAASALLDQRTNENTAFTNPAVIEVLCK